MTTQTKLILVATALGLVAMSCSAPTGEAEGPALSSVSSAVESSLDVPPHAAAVKVKVGANLDTWIIACDDTKKLRLVIRAHNSGNFFQQAVLDTECVGTPAIARWNEAEFSVVKVYINNTGGHLRELVFPDSRSFTNRHWTDLSNLTSFGPIIGSPIIADVGPEGDVSVLVKQAGDFLHTFDFFDWEWSTRPVLFASGGVMTTPNQVSAQWSVVGTPLLAGRGFNASNDNQGWLARRTGGFGNSYVNYRSLNNGGTLMGTPAVYANRVFAAFGTDRQLKSRAASALSNAAWTTFSADCKLGFGSPVAPPEIVPSSFNTVELYARSSTGEMMWWSAGATWCGFAPLTQKMGSAPSWVLGDTGEVPGIRADFDFIYSDQKWRNVVYYDAQAHDTTVIQNFTVLH